MAFLRILSSRRSPLAALARPMSAAATSTKSTVGFIGLGQMGARMAENLRLKGHQLVVSDPVAANLAPLADKGAVVAGSPKEVAALADTVITMLPSTDVVRHVFLGEGGIHEALRPEHVLIDSSTIDPLGAKHVSDEIHARGATFVDAPVSGGVMGAQNATLTFMVGGTPAEFERVKSLLADMGRNIVHCGGSSTGQVAKVCNNLSLAIQMASVSEAINLGVALSMDPAILRGIMNTSTGQCWSSTVNHPYPGLMENVPAANDYKGGFSCSLIRKDLGIAVDVAKQAEVTIPLTHTMHQFYNMMVNQGHGNKDFSYVLQFLKSGK